MTTVAEKMWRWGAEDARGAPHPVTADQARKHAAHAREVDDTCCRAYWLAYARALRARETSQ